VFHRIEVPCRIEGLLQDRGGIVASQLLLQNRGAFQDRGVVWSSANIVVPYRIEVELQHLNCHHRIGVPCRIEDKGG
jgi:hypothetical protein